MCQTGNEKTRPLLIAADDERQHIFRRRLLTYFFTSTVTGVLLFGWITHTEFDRLEQVGQTLHGGIVRLEPEKWIGKELPLRDYIVNGQDLMTGHWHVLLIRPGCKNAFEQNAAGKNCKMVLPSE